jgi:hypothetical protein
MDFRRCCGRCEVITAAERQVKERGIMFSGEMVRALLREENPKTQTRRIVKPQPKGELGIPADCPYGEVGDRLWVRERWGIDGCGRHVPLKKENWPNGWPIDRLFYFADNEDWYRFDRRSSLFMPRWASRITLEIVNRYPQRLQTIRHRDARAEGAIDIEDFTSLWNRINGETFPWKYNPLVWVIEFKRVQN